MDGTMDLKGSASQVLSVAAATKEYESRSKQILECQRQIKFWKEKLTTLQNERNQHFKMAKLLLCAEYTWPQLSNDEKENKDVFLAVLQAKNLPSEVDELLPDNQLLQDYDDYDYDYDDPAPEGWHIPESLLLDRDVCLARVRRKETWRGFRGKTHSIVPPTLRGDKEIMLAAFKYDQHAISYMSEDLRADMDLFEAYFGHKNASGGYWQYFCEDFRSDEKLIMKLCSHPEITIDFMKHCSQILINDKQFFLRAVEAITSSPRDQTSLRPVHCDHVILFYAPDHLRDDFEVVMSCMRQSGMNLKYASARLRKNDEIVSAACTKDPGAYRFKRYNGDEDLASKLSSMRFSWLSSSECPALPENLKSNVDFVATILGATDGKLWKSLSLEMKSNVQVASALICHHFYGDRKAVVEALHLCPQLLSDRMAVKNLIQNSVWRVADLQWLLTISQIDIRNDKELMLEAIRIKVQCWKYCSEELKDDKGIIFAIAERDPYAFTMVDNTFLMNHPELITRAVETMTGEWASYEWHGFCHSIPQQMWLNRSVVLAFLHADQHIDRSSRERFADDEELILSSMKANNDHFAYLASDALRKNKDFVLKALSISVEVLQWVSIDMARDFEVALRAISNDVRAVWFYLETRSGEKVQGGLEFITSFAQKVRTNLRNYAMFQMEIVEQMALPPAGKKRRTSLSMLNQGPVMLSTYKDRISEYLGLLRSEEDFEVYLAASDRIAVWGF